MKASTSAGVASNSLKKGDVLATARYAGIQAAKEASTLLLHATSIVLSGVEIGFSVGDTHVDIEARVDCVGPWGPEAQALSAVTVAALTVYDMCKAADRTMTIGEVELVEISGRPAGVWRRAGLGHENTD